MPGLRKGRPDDTNDKLFKPSARTSSRHSPCSEADLKLESRKMRKRAVNAKTSTNIPTILEIPNRSAGKLYVPELLIYFEIILLLVAIFWQTTWNAGIMEKWNTGFGEMRSIFNIDDTDQKLESENHPPIIPNIPFFQYSIIP